MQPGHIRPLALGIVWRDDALLVFEGHHPGEGETFYRPLGGGIEFGERGREALRREFREEIQAELLDVHYLATLENIFTHDGQIGHEIVLLFQAALADPSLYEREIFTVCEESQLLTARWVPVREFQTGGLVLYPNGLLEFLSGEDGLE